MNHRALRETIRFYLVDCKTKMGKAIDIGLLLLNLLLCLLFALDGYFPHHAELFRQIDTVVVIILIVEFLLRLYAAEDRRKFFTQWYTIIDILAILPTAIGWFLPSAKFAFLKTLKVLRLFRAFRFLRFLETQEFFFGSVADYMLRIMRLLTSVGILFFVTAGLIYTVESSVNDSIQTFGDAFYFTVVTLTTVGFGDITPITEYGKWITTIMILTGIVIVPWQAGQIIRMGVLMQDKKPVICSHCGLKYHDKDASHCKHCGNIIYQEVDG